MFAFAGCFDDFSVETGIRRYSVTQDIINPPDSFLVLMPLSNNTNVRTFLQTETNSVWHIQKTDAALSLIWLKRFRADRSYLLELNDAVGLEPKIHKCNTTKKALIAFN